MKKKKVLEQIEKIEIPSAIHERSKEGIMKASQDMKQGKLRRVYSSSIVAVASILIISLLTFNTGFTFPLKGFYEDIFNKKGAITDVVYKQATEEVKIKMGSPHISSDYITIPLTIDLLYADSLPYSVVDVLVLNDFQVIGDSQSVIDHSVIEMIPNTLDENVSRLEIPTGSKILYGVFNKANQINMSPQESYHAVLRVQTSSLNDYNTISLKINSFLGYMFANNPLLIEGQWEDTVRLEQN